MTMPEELDEFLAGLKDQEFLRQHPWAVKLLQQHNPDLLKRVEVPVEGGGKTHGVPGMVTPPCGRCGGDVIKGVKCFEDFKMNKTVQMLSLGSAFNRLHSGDYVYLAANDGKIYRYPRAQAERAGFSLYDAAGGVTKPEDGMYLMRKDPNDQ
jgi:hypothetical protein